MEAGHGQSSECECGHIKRVERSGRRTHEALLSWLVPYSLDLADVVECHVVFAEQAAVDDEIAFAAFGREYRTLC